METPICSACNDTHTMTLRDRDVMYTHCPTPCQDCRAGGNGPFCATTPCTCGCHATRQTAIAGRAEAEPGSDEHRAVFGVGTVPQ